MNPFEIRSDVLSMTKDYVNKQQEIVDDFVQHVFLATLSSCRAAVNAWQSLCQTYKYQS